MIRFILCVIVVVGFLILSIPILFVEWIIGKFNPMAKEISSLRIVQAVFRFILWISGVKLTVIGEENVPTDVPVLYIGNHRSFFDVPITYPRCPIRTGYIAKKEMEKVPLLSTWMKRLHCLFLDRNDLKQGFHEGSFKIAAKTNCPIIPMAISGSADIWENHFPRVKKTHVILEYGKPIYIDQLEKEDKKHLGAYTQNIIHEMLVKNKAQL